MLRGFDEPVVPWSVLEAADREADTRRRSAELTRRDPALRALVRGRRPVHDAGRPGRRPHFAELARMICYQQLAGAAARTIHGRFDALFDGHPTPEAVLALPDDDVARRGPVGREGRVDPRPRGAGRRG